MAPATRVAILAEFVARERLFGRAIQTYRIFITYS